MSVPSGVLLLTHVAVFVAYPKDVSSLSYRRRNTHPKGFSTLRVLLAECVFYLPGYVSLSLSFKTFSFLFFLRRLYIYLDNPKTRRAFSASIWRLYKCSHAVDV